MVVGTGVGCGVGDVVFPEQETTRVRPRMATARRAGRNAGRLLTARSLMPSRQGAKWKSTEQALPRGAFGCRKTDEKSPLGMGPSWVENHPLHRRRCDITSTRCLHPQKRRYAAAVLHRS